jgi:hypothetical protein
MEKDFKISYLKDYNITAFKSYHVLQKREGSSFTREHGILKQDYVDILNLAMRNGLSSFRNKGLVAITFFDTKHNQYTMLVEITDIIYVVSVWYNTNKKYQRIYHKVNQRINLFDYVLGERKHKVVYIKSKKSIKQRNKIRKVSKDEL